MLRESNVELVADVRAIPRSRTNPQFNRETLPVTLEASQIRYEHMTALGGRRGKVQSPEPSLNALWRVTAFRNYADYALTEEFGAALTHLREQGARHRCAIMCAEAVWWRCHRRLVADYLLAAGDSVMHILGPGHVDAATLTPGAVVRADRTVIYPPADPQLDLL